MQERQEQKGRIDPLADDQTSKAHSRQGVDKAPGEETPGDADNTVADTQKGKNKADGDPSKASDRSIDQP
ncbi:MAG TPA: hypothetical protein VFR58_02250 [Flavisolibacter sp.]|nr:hypothetical protein [Flavisolibacter sp.]